MIAIRTVLILGAGASRHCGYPLGRDLVDALCSLRGTHEIDALPDPEWTPKFAEEFLDRMRFFDPSSIDEFLEKNRDDAELRKFLIARELKKHENIDLMFPPNNAGWYRTLFDALLTGGRPEFSKNLSIVTFNYDRSLEAYLHKVLRYRFKMNEDKASIILKELPIVHLHGILGEYPRSLIKRTAPRMTSC